VAVLTRIHRPFSVGTAGNFTPKTVTEISGMGMYGYSTILDGQSFEIWLNRERPSGFPESQSRHFVGPEVRKLNPDRFNFSRKKLPF